MSSSNQKSASDMKRPRADDNEATSPQTNVKRPCLSVGTATMAISTSRLSTVESTSMGAFSLTKSPMIHPFREGAERRHGEPEKLGAPHVTPPTSGACLVTDGHPAIVDDQGACSVAGRGADVLSSSMSSLSSSSSGDRRSHGSNVKLWPEGLQNYRGGSNSSLPKSMPRPVSSLSSCGSPVSKSRGNISSYSNSSWEVKEVARRPQEEKNQGARCKYTLDRTRPTRIHGTGDENPAVVSPTLEHRVEHRLPGPLSCIAKGRGRKDEFRQFGGTKDTETFQVDGVHRFRGTDNVALMNRSFAIVSALGVTTWLGLVHVVYRITPQGAFVALEPFERFTAALAGLLILGSMVNKITPVLISSGARESLRSGVIIGALAVQVIASVTDILMAMLPTVPVMVDRFTGARVYPLRYCEWTVLAFLMTYFTEGMNVPQDEKKAGGGRSTKETLRHTWKLIRAPTLLGLSQCLSTLPGLIFPYCVNWSTWLVTMIVSCVLYLVLFPRLYLKRREFLNTKRDTNVDMNELYERVSLSYRLLAICVVMWTILVSMYFFTSYAHWFAPPDSLLAHKSLSFVGEAMVDVVAKALYMDVIVASHKAIFDDKARSTRRLEELRRMMSVVWETSSDVIFISVKKQNGNVTTMVSPSFRRIVGGTTSISGTAKHECRGETSAIKPIVFEMTKEDMDPSRVHDDQVDMKQNQTEPNPELISVRSLLVKAWAVDGSEDFLLCHNVHLEDGSSVQCEAKATKLGCSALVVVMRDTSERFRRFEAEKRAVSETTARLKDAEANRFTRHEVKNGLLASIGLCDGLREKLLERQEQGEASDERRRNSINSSSDSPRRTMDPKAYLADLDATLKEVLDTTLAEAMVRDVIHEVYTPKLERVDVGSVLQGVYGNHAKTRFPLVSDPSPLPVFLLDPQLLKYIHRNAVSNACKYGKRGGVVLTEARFDRSSGRLQIDVINLPAEDHENILRLGEHARETVFAPGQRLHTNVNTDGVHVSHSSGDGAWISRKCAKTMGGDCDIRFERDRTVFSFWCPATLYDVVLKAYPGALGDPSRFRLPADTWGVAIDDSKIQRKIMGRFFAMAGISEEKQLLLGKDASEIRGFSQRMAQLIKDHPTSYFLVLADENLDIVEDNNLDHTISGSLCIHNLRNQLEEKDEHRMLALVRSANDSASDVAIYNSRAHGFICKAPIQRDKIMEVLAPLWAKRFANRFPESLCGGEVTEASKLPRFDPDMKMSAAADVMQTLEVIDALCTQNGAVLGTRWPVIRDKLVSLKGELQRLDESEDVSKSLERVSHYSSPPMDFLSQWAEIRLKIIRIT